ncbi:hypothetical protein [Halobellus sp. H-GB7]|uniref:phage NrS-1 polymerase family protein n=1 Tax=Halobellus sp. H-GB7 TaxID=3069756 RepID=UPI0027B3170F|nr:hypothetical protein [Halobellus sp. H-GB7]MDQ2055285.1 hypothetical protein [Halobellus sp. H-GB7]
MTTQITLDGSVLPTALIEYDQWICWDEQERNGKPTKVPITPGSGEFASSTDEQTWTSFDDALEYAELGDATGIGFVFTDDDPFVGVDLDDCRDPDSGTADEAAEDIIDRLDSYTERSPSGTGYHVLVQGELPDGRNRKGTIEMYDSGRFFTVTGDHVAETPTAVATRQDALAAVHREYVQDDIGEPRDKDSSGETAREPSTEIDLDNQELLEKAQNASNGEKFERLWNGNMLGYESQSEADMALCFLLAFWTGGDATRVDQLFQQSGLMREKWDEVHYADGSTYGEKTIERAIAGTSEFYDPDATSVRETEDDIQGHDVAPSAGQRKQTYLTEKNRLLKERVSELEAALEEKNDRINTLEATVRDLQEALAERESEIEQLGDQDDVDDASDDVEESGSVKQTMWMRAKRFLADDK